MVKIMEYKYDKLMNEYPILFQQKTKTPMETCMCWGICCDEGWYEPLNKLCFNLQFLNKTYYSKYKCRIQADQVKQKFGGLRFYYTVVYEPNLFFRMIRNGFYYLSYLINKSVSFKYKIVVDENEKEVQTCVQITQKEYNDLENKNATNIKKQNGKFYKNKIVKQAKKGHKQLLNHKFLHKIDDICVVILNKIARIKPNKKQEIILGVLNDISDSLIRQCEQSCWDTCQICGEKNDYSKKNIITTNGWVKRICRDCSNKMDQCEIRKRDQKSRNEYQPRILSFQRGYDYLSLYYPCSIHYKQRYYGSIIHALYSIKDQEHRCLYDDIIKLCNSKHTNTLIQKYANEFGVFITEEDYDLLKQIVTARFKDYFSQNDKKMLLQTKSALLVNSNNKCDNVLGSCVCDNCKNKDHKDLYAKVLMQIRDQLEK